MGQVSLPEEIIKKYDDPDGSEFLLGELDGNPLSYQKYARQYFEKEIALDAIKQIYNHQPLTEELIRTLNPDISFFHQMGDWQYEDPNGGDDEVRLWESDQGYFCCEKNVLTDIEKVLRRIKVFYETGSYDNLDQVE